MICCWVLPRGKRGRNGFVTTCKEIHLRWLHRIHLVRADDDLHEARTPMPDVYHGQFRHEIDLNACQMEIKVTGRRCCATVTAGLHLINVPRRTPSILIKTSGRETAEPQRPKDWLLNATIFHAVTRIMHYVRGEKAPGAAMNLFQTSSNDRAGVVVATITCLWTRVIDCFTRNCTKKIPLPNQGTDRKLQRSILNSRSKKLENEYTKKLLSTYRPTEWPIYFFTFEFVPVPRTNPVSFINIWHD